MGQLIETAIATRRAPLAEAVAEARGLARGPHPDLPAAAIDAAGAGILADCEVPPPGRPGPPAGRPSRASRAVAPAKLANALAYATPLDGLPVVGVPSGNLVHDRCRCGRTERMPAPGVLRLRGVVPATRFDHLAARLRCLACGGPGRIVAMEGWSRCRPAALGWRRCATSTA